jgi:hypothetical protein
MNNKQNAPTVTSAQIAANPLLYAACLQPLAICDGDYGSTMETYFENFFDENNIPYDKCYNLYKEPKDLSKYKTIAFFTTNSYPKKIEKILDFDKSNLKTVIVISEWAYDLSSPLAEKLGIEIYTLDRFKNVIMKAADYFGY